MKLTSIFRALRALGTSSPSCHATCASTGLLAEPALAELGEPLLEQAQRLGEALTVLVFDFDDLASIEDLYGARVRRTMLGLIGRALRRVAGERGLAVRATRSRFVVLLPGCTRAAAVELMTVKLGKSCSFELDSAEHDLLLVPRMTALGATADTDSIRQMVLRTQVARHAPAGVAEPSPVPVPSPRPAAKAKFELPDDARVWAHQPQPPTFPMPLS